MSTKLLLQALAGEPTPRRPVWVMRQAGRMLPEYREVRARHSFLEVCAQPELAAEVTLQPLRRFPYDAAIIFADLMSPVSALGVPFDFDPGPVLERPLRTAADIDSLPEPAGGEIAPEVMAALRLVRAELPDDRALLGFGGAPLSIAAYLVQGRGAKDFPQLRALAARDEELFGRLLGKLSRLVAAYLIEQSRAGADAVQIFDSWAGLLCRADWVRLVRPHLLWLLEELGRHDVKRILFLHGAPQLVADYAELPSEGLAVDWRSDLLEVRRLAGDGKAIQGNLDPAVLLAGPDATRRAAAALLARVPPRGHIVNLGHGVMPETPLESVEALIETVHAEGTSR